MITVSYKTRSHSSSDPSLRGAGGECLLREGSGFPEVITQGIPL